ncbi:hypothetical protein FN846DRAFT_903366 [Sphaerosporella brunnea]|uniref:Uncharacterized protein n=1 Tax=Sphaerosporella brunnea TaxID=1250544 RepID=A0A5J5F731_9PEZI|nr:hypothetical protein FN846DRAFT_903366 [Sphaerosporella brunnea]
MPRRHQKLGPKTPIRKRPYESPKPRHTGGHYSDEDEVHTTPQGTRRQTRRRVALKMPTPRREPMLGTRENPWDLCTPPAKVKVEPLTPQFAFNSTPVIATGCASPDWRQATSRPDSQPYHHCFDNGNMPDLTWCTTTTGDMVPTGDIEYDENGVEKLHNYGYDWQHRRKAPKLRVQWPRVTSIKIKLELKTPTTTGVILNGDIEEDNNDAANDPHHLHPIAASDDHRQ